MAKAKTIMIQGTGSDTGKSVLTAAFAQKGLRVAPFKSQNMALNSFITREGGEIGRAQAVQAEAAMSEAIVAMNPILLKPNQDNNSQVIINGKAKENMTAKEYFAKGKENRQIIEKALSKLKDEFDVIVIEGGGSPAEINLREFDLVNMSVAKMAQAPVILVADIDRGGVFASIVGTLELLEPWERAQIKGIIINKFRGDLARFKTGVEFIETYTKIPVLGVIPYINNIKIPEEDSLSAHNFGSDDHELDIAIIGLPHISNFTDFSILAEEPKIKILYIRKPEELNNPDLIIIPGSKNTIEDLAYLYHIGMAEVIKEKYKNETPIIGICGGYQILGKTIKDPYHIESKTKEIEGLGLLDIETILNPKKVTSQVTAKIINPSQIFSSCKSLVEEKLTAYEIHQGKTKLSSQIEPLFKVKGKDKEELDGAISPDGLVWGTYLHGLFDNDLFRRNLINYLREKKGLTKLTEDIVSARQEREKAYNQLAEHVKKNINMDLLYNILEGVE